MFVDSDLEIPCRFNGLDMHGDCEPSSKSVHGPGVSAVLFNSAEYSDYPSEV